MWWPNKSPLHFTLPQTEVQEGTAYSFDPQPAHLVGREAPCKATAKAGLGVPAPSLELRLDLVLAQFTLGVACPDSGQFLRSIGKPQGDRLGTACWHRAENLSSKIVALGDRSHLPGSIYARSTEIFTTVERRATQVAEKPMCLAQTELRQYAEGRAVGLLLMGSRLLLGVQGAICYLRFAPEDHANLVL